MWIHTIFFLLASSSLFAGNASELTGLWKTQCVFVPKKHSAINTIEFDEQGNYRAKTQMFETRNCETKSINLTVNGQARDFNRNRFDHAVASVEMTLQSQGVVDHFNKREICGFTDWKPNVPREVSGRFCEPYSMPRTGVIAYDRFRIERGKLTFGGFPRRNDFSTPDDRPTATDPEWTYSKSSR